MKLCKKTGREEKRDFWWLAKSTQASICNSARDFSLGLVTITEKNFPDSTNYQASKPARPQPLQTGKLKGIERRRQRRNKIENQSGRYAPPSGGFGTGIASWQYCTREGHKSKMNPLLSHGLEIAFIHSQVYRSTTEPQSLILIISSRQSLILRGANEQAS